MDIHNNERMNRLVGEQERLTELTLQRIYNGPSETSAMQRPSWETVSRTAGQEISRLLRNLIVQSVFGVAIVIQCFRLSMTAGTTF
jgi:hypothetical protein